MFAVNNKTNQMMIWTAALHRHVKRKLLLIKPQLLETIIADHRMILHQKNKTK